MIKLSATPFGHGIRYGVTSVLKKGFGGASSNFDKRCALVIPFIITAAEFDQIATIKGVEFCIIPPCSPYSHLGAATWFNDLPTMAVEQTQNLFEGLSILADFDNRLIFIAESEADDNELRQRVLGSFAIDLSPVSSPTKPADIKNKIAIHAEVRTADDIYRALSEGADGLGVVNAERLFGNDKVDEFETESFVQMIKDNPQVLPLPVRFFDSVHKNVFGEKQIQTPQANLGYRGIRLLELNNDYFERFVAGLEKLGLEQIIVVLPMVTSVSEVRKFRERLDARWNTLGVTVETPAAALSINDLLQVSDYIQIGLNDLTQYTVAWDRDIPHKERLPEDYIVEPVSKLIVSITTACVGAGVQYTLGLDLRPCKKLASQLLRLGITNISCATALVKPWRDTFAFLDSN